MRLDALIRVSQRDGREDLRSPAQQREMIERWAEANAAVVVKVHESIDVSGKTMDRVDVDNALRRIRSGETDGIAVAWLDRFSRAPVDEALRVYNDIQAAGGKVVAADMSGLDARDPTGEFALTVMLGVNRMQWRKTAERYDMSRRDAIREGKAVGGAPFGYRFADPTPRGERGVVDSRLVPDDTAPIARELFERKAAGATWLELARWLDSVAPKEGKWARSTVVGIIGRRTYLGEVSHGSYRNPKAHEPLVSASLWRRAQNPPGRRTPRGTYLLTGLVRCAGCGRRMKGGSLGSYRGAKRIYNCDNRGCTERSTVIAGRLDGEVTEQFLARVEGFRLQVVEDVEVDLARAEVERLTGEVERLAVVVPSHPAAVGAHQSALSEAERLLEVAEDRLHQMTASVAGDEVRELRRDWPTLTLDDRREIVRTGIDAVLVRRALRRTGNLPVADRILVVFQGEGPVELRDGGRTTVARRWTWNDDVSSLVSAA